MQKYKNKYFSIVSPLWEEHTMPVLLFELKTTQFKLQDRDKF